MGDVVDLDHWRRAQRLCPILVDRFGAAFFIKDAAARVVDDDRVVRARDLAIEWISRRSGRAVDTDAAVRIERLLRALVVGHLAEGTVRRR